MSMMNLDDIKGMFAEADKPVLTLYLNTNNADEANQASNPRWRVWLKERLRELSDQQAGGAWTQIHERVEAFFADYQPDSKSLVLFVGPDFQRDITLEVPLENQVSYGKPAVLPLLWAIDEYEPYLVALVDQEKARFILTRLGMVEFEEGIESDLDEYEFREKTIMPSASAVAGGHGATQGSHRDIFEDTIREHHNRFYREAVENVGAIADKHGVARIILGGAEESAHAVRRFLPDALADQVVAVLPIPMRSSSKEAVDLAASTVLDYEREGEMALVNQVIDFAKSGGRGALGLKAVQEALEMQRVELLVIPYPMEDADLAAELPLRVFASGGNVELVHGAAAERLKEEGGIGARLYYAL